jgi:hypothetical protein
MLAVVGTAVVAEVTAVVVAASTTVAVVANTTEESTITRAAEPIGTPTKATMPPTTLTRIITTMTNVRGSTAGL